MTGAARCAQPGRSRASLGLGPLGGALWIGLAMLGLARVGAAQPNVFRSPPAFTLDDRSPGGAAPARRSPPYLTGARIAAIDDGALVIDADSGMLARVDAGGASIAQLAIGRDAGVMAYDDIAQVAYVADRRGDRIVAVRVGRRELAIAATWRTPAEPYGVALTPDRATAVVTHIADRLLVGYDVATGRERWRTAIAAEPRGLAVSPDGARALVAYLGTGALDEIALADRAVIHRALPRHSEDQAARGAFAVTWLGDDLAVSPFQLEKPDSDTRMPGFYGGGREPPITQHLALLGMTGRRRAAVADVSLRLPRAVAWDAAHDALYLAGLGNDRIVQLVHASQVDVRAGIAWALPGGDRCGADGLAIGPDGNLLVWCSFTRSVARITTIDRDGALAPHWHAARGPELTASALDATQHLGMVLFHTASHHVSDLGLACANCHHDGRADGLSWRIGDQMLQTPMLAGRVANTAPYGWRGHAPDLPASLRATIRRLDGGGLDRPQIAALAAYLEAMPPVRPPTRDPAAVARGKAIFEAIGCASCHDGAAYTDQERHQFAPSPGAFDTPSLLGLAASAPYFHDGSAATLEALLGDHGGVHDMSAPSRALGERELADLVAFLESL